MLQKWWMLAELLNTNIVYNLGGAQAPCRAALVVHFETIVVVVEHFETIGKSASHFQATLAK